MIGIDTNILVYAFRSDLSQHPIATETITNLMNSSIPWAIAWPSIYEFLRLVTHSKVFKIPSSRKEAIAAIKSLTESPSLNLLSNGLAHFETLSELATEIEAKGNIFFDVHIASIFKEHGITEIITNDADYLKFRDFKITNPFNNQ